MLCSNVAFAELFYLDYDKKQFTSSTDFTKQFVHWFMKQLKLKWPCRGMFVFIEGDVISFLPHLKTNNFHFLLLFRIYYANLILWWFGGEAQDLFASV
jgi:hypothetical protein